MLGGQDPARFRMAFVHIARLLFPPLLNIGRLGARELRRVARSAVCRLCNSRLSRTILLLSWRSSPGLPFEHLSPRAVAAAQRG